MLPWRGGPRCSTRVWRAARRGSTLSGVRTDYLSISIYKHQPARLSAGRDAMLPWRGGPRCPARIQGAARRGSDIPGARF